MPDSGYNDPMNNTKPTSCTVLDPLANLPPASCFKAKTAPGSIKSTGTTVTDNAQLANEAITCPLDTSPKELKIRAADDFHYHFRDGVALTRTVTDAAQQFKRVVAMPNTQPPITTVKQALDYRQRILDAVPTALNKTSITHKASSNFDPLMMLYLTADTTVADIQAASVCPHILGFKLYPAGATTGSSAGITDLNQLASVLEALQKHQVHLSIHGEVTDPQVDCFDREQVFIERYLSHWVKQFPKLKIVLEHVTTRYAVDFVKQQDAQRVAATITPHHLWCNRNHLLAQRLRPHYYCLPILKRNDDQVALIEAAISGDPHFFLGSDGAPHVQTDKESACGCAGIYHGAHTLALYAALFDHYQALDKLENFCSIHGAQFYGLALHQEHITLQAKSNTIASALALADNKVIPLFAAQAWPWQLMQYK